MNKMLILDDNERFVNSLKQSISQFKGYESEIEVAATSSEAIELVRSAVAKQQNFSVFLIDQNLGEEIDGIQVMGELLMIQPDADTIIFTGYDTPEDGLRAYEAGASRYFPKPFASGELEFTLKELALSRRVRLAEARQSRQFKVAALLAEAVGTSVTLEETMDGILATLYSIFENTRLCILLFDKDQKTLHFAPGTLKYYEIQNHKYTQSDAFSIDQGATVCLVAKQTLENKKVEWRNIKIASDDPEYLNLNPTTKSECCVGLLNKEQELLGVIALEREFINGFDDSDLELIKIAARHASIAIERAQNSELLINKSVLSTQKLNIKDQLKVFICYTSQDRFAVQELYSILKAENWIDPWLDKAKILPGQDWEMVIEKAVEDSDVVIICLSNNIYNKEGYVQKEIRYAYDIALEKPEGKIYLIPLRLDECVVPRKLKSFHWVDYFGLEKEESCSSLLSSLRICFTNIK